MASYALRPLATRLGAEVIGFDLAGQALTPDFIQQVSCHARF